MSVEIIPSILVKTREELVEKSIIIEPYVEKAHLDIADGIFVPNMTIGGFEELEELETSLQFGVHLMVSKPENHIHRWLQTPADRFTFHVEATKKTSEIIETVKETDKLVGIALNPKTLIKEIESFIDVIDFVHFMTVKPGFYGGEFDESVIDKITDFHYFYPDKQIQVDGGINPDNAPRLIQAGASFLIVGSYIWKNHDAGKAIETLKKII